MPYAPHADRPRPWPLPWPATVNDVGGGGGGGGVVGGAVVTGGGAGVGVHAGWHDCISAAAATAATPRDRRRIIGV